jgi:hypothetical protein
MGAFVILALPIMLGCLTHFSNGKTWIITFFWVLVGLFELVVMFKAVIPFIRRNIIGHRLWLFHADDGVLHLHDKEFVRRHIEDERMVVSFRIGGWFDRDIRIQGHRPVSDSAYGAAMVEKQRDALGVEMQKLIILMQRSRETMGRSKHAQLLRERIEALMKTFHPIVTDEWRQRAEHELGENPPKPPNRFLN